MSWVSRLPMRSKLSFSARFGYSHKKDNWLLPGLAMWLAVACAALTSTYVGVTCTLFEYMYKIQPTPYLDEVFHIPQARNYCDGNFTEWDPKITTLPGLYLLSVGVLKPLSWILSKPEMCVSVYALRSVNMILSTAMLYVVYSLLRHIHGHKDELDVMRGMFSAVNICVFPVLYFFNFLYYTDVASTFLVLLAYLLCLQQRHRTAAVVGFVSVVVRQTNIVWVAFFGLLAFAELLKDNSSMNKKKFTISIVRSYKYLELLWATSLQVALTNGVAGKTFIMSVINQLIGYLCVAALFIMFVIYNGSLVVGDKLAHQASLHLTQFLYFCLFVLTFMFPLALPYTFSLHRTLRRRALPVAITTLIMLAIVHFNTIAHPYLLADNRHYTFYLWRRIINRNFFSRYVLVPAYVLGACWVASILRRTDYIFRIGFIVCLIASIVPQSLLEFRYFIIPYIMLRLQIHKPELWQVVAEFVLYVLVNGSTVALYKVRTITWPNMDEPQRFLW